MIRSNGSISLALSIRGVLYIVERNDSTVLAL